MDLGHLHNATALEGKQVYVSKLGDRNKKTCGGLKIGRACIKTGDPKIGCLKIGRAFGCPFRFPFDQPQRAPSTRARSSLEWIGLTRGCSQ